MGVLPGVLVAALFIGAYVAVPVGGRPPLLVAVTAGCAAALLTTAVRRRLIRSPWGPIALGFALRALADILDLLGPEAVAAPVAEPLRLLAYVPLLAGVWRLWQDSRSSRWVEDILDGGVVLGAAVVAIAFVVASGPSEASIWSLTRAHAVTVLNSLVAVGLLRLLVGGGSLRSGRWLAGASALLFAADLAHSELALAGRHVEGGLLDLLWPAAYLGASIALRTARPQDSQRTQDAVPSRMRLGVVTTALAAVVLISVPVQPGPARAAVTVATLVAVLCAGARMYLLRARWLHSERHVRWILERAHDPYASIDLTGVVRSWNTAAEATFGYSSDEAIGRPLQQLIFPDHPTGDFVRWLHEVREGGSSRLLERPVVVPAAAADGSPRSIEVVMWAVGQGTGRLLHAHLRDVTARSHADALLRRQALYDPLTGVANRALLCDRVELALAGIRRTGGLVAFLLVDLDDFRQINEARGHETGDAMLVEAATRIQRTVRQTDTVARFGGDEFGVVVTDLSAPDDIERIAAGVLSALCEGDPSIRASIGVVTSDDAEALSELFACADVALAEVKRRGKGGIGRYDSALHATNQRRAQLRADLPRAVEAGDLAVAYQPIIELADEAVVGAEALARWTHPVLGPVPPAEFIGVAEESGLILSVGESVLRRACRDAAAWPDGPRGPLDISVNVSARQLRPGFVETVLSALSDAGLPAHRLVLELTETILIESVDQVVATMQLLRRHGVRFAIDDFGTGYASLATLADLPVDCIKVDRQFVAMCTGDVHQHALAHAAVRLGQSLGLPVVAEGVETLEQHERLHEWACPRAQGYLHGRPMGTDALVARLVPGQHQPGRITHSAPAD